MDEIKQTSWGHARTHSLRHVRPSSYPDIVYPFIYKIQQTTIPERKKTKKKLYRDKKQNAKANGKFLLYLVNFNLFHSSRVLPQTLSISTHTHLKRETCAYSQQTHTCLGELFVAYYTQAIVSPYMGKVQNEGCIPLFIVLISQEEEDGIGIGSSRDVISIPSSISDSRRRTLTKATTTKIVVLDEESRACNNSSRLALLRLTPLGVETLPIHNEWNYSVFLFFIFFKKKVVREKQNKLKKNRPLEISSERSWCGKEQQTCTTEGLVRI